MVVLDKKKIFSPDSNYISFFQVDFDEKAAKKITDANGCVSKENFIQAINQSINNEVMKTSP